MRFVLVGLPAARPGRTGAFPVVHGMLYAGLSEPTVREAGIAA